jgi:hypothetical protein
VFFAIADFPAYIGSESRTSSDNLYPKRRRFNDG